jgi:Domain of unknown function (DUF3844)
MPGSQFKQVISVLLLPFNLPPRKPSRLNARYGWQEWKEERLSKSSGLVSSHPEPKVTPSSEPQKTNPSTLTSVCHASNSSCVDATNNCSGHGHCYRKYTSTDEAVSSDCFACKCIDTIVENPDGTVKKLQWGGPACQKQDVSTPFFLLGGITLFVLTASAAGIRLLFTVGKEDLPSVIAAGIEATRTPR